MKRGSLLKQPVGCVRCCRVRGGYSHRPQDVRLQSHGLKLSCLAVETRGHRASGHRRPKRPPGWQVGAQEASPSLAALRHWRQNDANMVAACNPVSRTLRPAFRCQPAQPRRPLLQCSPPGCSWASLQQHSIWSVDKTRRKQVMAT